MSEIKNIRKRDGRIVEFDQSKISEAIWKAAETVGGNDREMAERISGQITSVLEVFFRGPDTIPTVEQIQDLVEKILIENGHAKTAKAYILYRARQTQQREQTESIIGKGRADERLNFSNEALEILKRHYLLKDEQGDIVETPRELIDRIAKTLALANKRDGEEGHHGSSQAFFDLMANLEFMPEQLAGRYTLRIPDSMEGIFDTLKYHAIILQKGGETEIDLSNLRPTHDIVQTLPQTASGPVSFLRVFNTVTEEIKQDSTAPVVSTATLRVDHPDILEFIMSKSDAKTLSNFTTSVAVTEEFMEALKNDTFYDLINPRTKTTVKQLRAREVYNLIISSAWRSGNPKISFVKNTTQIWPLSSIHTGAIAVNRFVARDKKDFDWKRLEGAVQTAVHLLSSAIDAYAISSIKNLSASPDSQQIGVGVMGFADALSLLNISYRSEEAIRKGEELMEFIEKKAKEAAATLKENGGNSREHALVTAITSTETVRKIAGVSKGIEPTTPGNITPEHHLRMQSAFQKYSHQPVEKVIYLPGTASMQDVEKICLLAYDLGTKGVTICRNTTKTTPSITPERHIAEFIPPPPIIIHTTDLTTPQLGELEIQSTRPHQTLQNKAEATEHQLQ